MDCCWTFGPRDQMAGNILCQWFDGSTGYAATHHKATRYHDLQWHFTWLENSSGYNWNHLKLSHLCWTGCVICLHQDVAPFALIDASLQTSIKVVFIVCKEIHYTQDSSRSFVFCKDISPLHCVAVRLWIHYREYHRIMYTSVTSSSKWRHWSKHNSMIFSVVYP